MKRRHRLGWALGALAGIASLAGLATAGSGAGDAPLAVISRAAPDYVSDRSCALCHADIARSYSEVGMARSFFRPRRDNRIEDFAAPPFDHAPSRQRFQIAPQGDGLVFRRWQLDGKGQPARLFEQPVDWVLGSGHHSRTYLYRTPDGALFQLPLAWYTQEGRWGMAPGYDRPDHDGVLRRGRRECLFCHNAYPEVPAGSDAEEAPHLFPAELPEGTGCQRCHGPGGEHMRRAMGGVDTRAEIRAAIVNPAKLAPALRDDVCDQCHLLPLVALVGVRRAGRGDYSFRPGTPLPDYQVAVDAEEAGTPAERFEIDHQSFRMKQSRCFTASPGRLSCLTCHDPHRHVPETERAAHYRAACQGCHAGNACKRTRSEAEASSPGVDGSDCATCHLPKRRPRDVVHVLMTDHKIQRPPSGAALAALTAPLVESEPVLTGVRVLEPARLPSPRLAEIHRAVPVLRTGASPEALEHLAKILATPGVAGEDDASYRFELAGGLLRRRQYAPAEALLSSLLARDPALAAGPRAGRLWEWLGLANDGLGKPLEAEAALRKALAAPAPGVDRPEVASRLAQILAKQGRHAEAAELLAQAVAARPNLAAAWYQLGLSQGALGKVAEARASLGRAALLDPRLAGAAEAALARLSAEGAARR